MASPLKISETRFQRGGVDGVDNDMAQPSDPSGSVSPPADVDRPQTSPVGHEYLDCNRGIDILEG